MKNQVYNPYLPLNEYVPDGEPHLFDGRVYIYGSHDVANGTKYCEGHYVTWSAPENDLTDWRYEGVIYRRDQDPSNTADKMQLWAPDVTRGPDGRYYLYYCFSFYPEIGVAVSNSPAGPFEFYGHVKYPSHIEGGKTLQEFMPFDPAVLTDDDGRVYLYYGFAPAGEKAMILPKFDPATIPEEYREMASVISRIKLGENGMVAELEPDMITLKAVPQVCIPGGNHTEGTGFEGHGFFEASSIRKVGTKYYFVYSSQKSHELCYAVSDQPMSDYIYGGTIVSNGDVGYQGRQAPINVLGNNHGGMVCANGQWYIFYHRQTNGTEFSRQGCAEPITIAADGSIPQVEITSCGLNGGPLAGAGIYPASIACHLTCPTTKSIINYQDPVMKQQVRITQETADDVQYITDIKDQTTIGYKYFNCTDLQRIALRVRGQFQGALEVTLDADGAKKVSQCAVQLDSTDWQVITCDVQVPDGKQAIYLNMTGQGAIDLLTIELIR